MPPKLTKEEIESTGFYYSENLIPESQYRREEIDKVLIRATGKTGVHLERFKKELFDLGVVVKVERKLPNWIEDCPSANSETCETCNNCEIFDFALFDIIEAGYTAWEPLIEISSIKKPKLEYDVGACMAVEPLI